LPRAPTGSLSHGERGGERGYALSIGSNPLTPSLSPAGRGEGEGALISKKNAFVLINCSLFF